MFDNVTLFISFFTFPFIVFFFFSSRRRHTRCGRDWSFRRVLFRSKRLVYGIKGIAELFGCSISTAQRIKDSGKIKKALTQVGRKIVVDADKALELYKK